MSKNEKIIKNTFESGSVRDALIFITLCVHNAFPDFNFRGIEVTRLVTSKKIIEGKSWNHNFTIRLSEANGIPAWEVRCHRISNGETTDKKALLDATALTLI